MTFHGAADNDQIAAGKIGVNDSAAGQNTDGDFSGLHHLSRAAAAADVEEFDIQAVFAKNSRFIGNPYRGLRTADRAVGKAELVERRLRADFRSRGEEDQKKCE